MPIAQIEENDICMVPIFKKLYLLKKCEKTR